MEVAQNQQANICIFFYGTGNENNKLGAGYFVHKGIMSADKGVEFYTDGMSYIILRGLWCNIIVLNVHAPTEDKIDDIITRLLHVATINVDSPGLTSEFI
jgi:hypothetical protein